MEDTAAQWIQANEALEILTVPISFLICTETRAAYFILPVGNFLPFFPHLFFFFHFRTLLAGLLLSEM